MRKLLSFILLCCCYIECQSGKEIYPFPNGEHGKELSITAEKIESLEAMNCKLSLQIEELKTSLKEMKERERQMETIQEEMKLYLTQLRVLIEETIKGKSLSEEIPPLE